MRKTSSKIQVGEKYGKLEIVNWYRERNISGRSKIMVKCKCDCGGESIMQYQTLKYEGGPSCPNCKESSTRLRTSYSKQKTIDKYYKQLKSNAIRRRTRYKQHREMKFAISIEDISRLLKDQNYKCALSGLDICIEDGSASLDRINNSLDYTLDNIQWVHRYINYMKVDLPQNTFIEFCRLVSTYNP